MHGKLRSLQVAKNAKCHGSDDLVEVTVVYLPPSRRVEFDGTWQRWCATATLMLIQVSRTSTRIVNQMTERKYGAEAVERAVNLRQVDR